jgi:hypothetical protein
MAPPHRLRCWHRDRSTADGETVKHPRSAGGTASKVLWHICGTKGEKRCPAGSGPGTTRQDRNPSQRLMPRSSGHHAPNASTRYAKGRAPNRSTTPRPANTTKAQTDPVTHQRQVAAGCGVRPPLAPMSANPMGYRSRVATSRRHSTKPPRGRSPSDSKRTRLCSLSFPRVTRAVDWSTLLVTHQIRSQSDAPRVS